MDRSGALAFLQQAGFAKLMRAAGREEIDSPTGYGPALDVAFEYYGAFRPNEPVVLEADLIGFKSLLRAVVLDLIEPTVCTYVDTQVDAPLTEVKGSQLCEQVQAMLVTAWNRAAAAGYSGMNEVGGFRVNLDFVENQDWAES